MHKPKWFSKDTIMVSTAPTCGLTKGGRLLPLIDLKTGERVKVNDPDTGVPVDAINDKMLEDMQAMKRGETTSTLRFIDSSEVNLRSAIPTYYDSRMEQAFFSEIETNPVYEGFSVMTIAEMVEAGLLFTRGGHGSPSAEQRVGDVPYIKVSDLRAGTVNINPTNRIPRRVAEKQFWRGDGSGLQEFDLLCPERTSKNIGDFCVLMPGQEQVVLTKEVIILRPGPKAAFDPFYLLWAFTLEIVREQWKRVIFMQTNREDVGKRYLEIKIPVAPSAEVAKKVSEPFRSYYMSMALAREALTSYLAESGSHHFYMEGSAAALDAEPVIEPGVSDVTL